MMQPALENQSTSPIYTVTHLSKALKGLVEDAFSHIKVRGEVSSVKCHTSGHIYYTLKDQDSVLDAVSWRGSQVSRSFQTGPVKLADGLEIIATGHLTTYGGRSKYQMIVDSFIPTGEGALLKLLEERKRKLAQEGLFELKKPLPFMPKKIGVITSSTGAVIRDILHRLHDRFPCHVMVYPVPVQGLGACDQIAKAIHDFNTIESIKPDLIIVARGGGSLEDLWAFNEENVARAAAASIIPLISAVGHETDTTLIDYVSDKRAPTPTAAAEIAVPVWRDLVETVFFWTQRFYQSSINYLSQKSLTLEHLQKNLKSPKTILEEKEIRVDEFYERLHDSMQDSLVLKHNQLLTLKTPSPIMQCILYEERLKSLADRQAMSLETSLSKRQDKLVNLNNILNAMSYHKVLERGFCLVTHDQKPITKASHASLQKDLTLTFADGTITAIPKLDK